MLEILLLGEQRVALDGSLVAGLASPKAMALLGFLLLHRDAPQHREYIAAQFWPDSTDTQARTNLRRELHSLRTGLPHADRWLAADHGTLMWRPSDDCRLDVAVFEAAADAASAAHAAGDDAGFRPAAAEAVRAYRGELMPALYDDWAAIERDRLHRRCLALIDQLAVLERDAGAYGEAIDLARRRIDLEPLEEVGYRTLLRLQALSGDRAAALQTYHRCVSVLERELGVAPDHATTAEYEQLARPHHLGPAVPATLAAPTATTVPTPSPVRLVGREQELGLLHERWLEAMDGVAGFAVIAGEAGVGKTRLLDELCSVVQRGGSQAMRARCFAPEAGSPWPQCRSGCAARRCSRPAAASSRCGPVRSTVSSRRRTPDRWSRCARWPMPGNATGSSRAWPGQSCQPAGHLSWCSTMSSGVTRTPSPGSSCCCTWAGIIRCLSSPRHGSTRSPATPSSPRCCGYCVQLAR